MKATALLIVSAFAGLAADELPDFPGKPTYVRVCGECHGPDAVTGMGHDRAGWKDIVDEMIVRGATANEKELKEIVDYLAKAFPKKSELAHRR